LTGAARGIATLLQTGMRGLEEKRRKKLQMKNEATAREPSDGPKARQESVINFGGGRNRRQNGRGTARKKQSKSTQLRKDVLPKKRGTAGFFTKKRGLEKEGGVYGQLGRRAVVVRQWGGPP